ncbi:MAG: hypothetical protein KDD10_07985 [Phaeodactylibacter sp.]|nr:hypothetical protein [Phaeodactylibacter sp.]MCB9295821.1 hypothetical protein [Lewinellaceae bacterium]
MKKYTILCFLALVLNATLPAQNAPALPNLDGWWVVVGIQKDDIGVATTWMSEWLVKGGSLTAAYKGMLAQASMSNPNWQIRNFRSGGGTVYFEILQNISGTQSQLNITLTEMDGNAIRGQYTRLDDYSGIYRQQYRGAIELRKIEMNVDPALAAQLPGTWKNNGFQSFDIAPESTTFNELLSIERTKEGGILLKNKGRDANNIETNSEFLLIYLRQAGSQIKMVIYSPKGECMNPGCGYLAEYTFTGSPSAGLMQGRWEGVFANQLIFRGQGTSTYQKLP